MKLISWQCGEVGVVSFCPKSDDLCSHAWSHRGRARESWFFPYPSCSLLKPSLTADAISFLKNWMAQFTLNARQCLKRSPFNPRLRNIQHLRIILLPVRACCLLWLQPGFPSQTVKLGACDYLKLAVAPASFTNQKNLFSSYFCQAVKKVHQQQNGCLCNQPQLTGAGCTYYYF